VELNCLHLGWAKVVVDVEHSRGALLDKLVGLARTALETKVLLVVMHRTKRAREGMLGRIVGERRCANMRVSKEGDGGIDWS